MLGPVVFFPGPLTRRVLLAVPVALSVILACGFAPTPNGSVYGEVPGALPVGFHYVYNDAYTGWPVTPVHAQHPVRGSFLDPRGLDDTGRSGYHFGIDVSVDDQQPEQGAPAGLSHRVYAIESGTVDQPSGNLGRPCLDRRLEVGHFDYWHVSTIVHQGERIRAGQQIGWSCLAVWHVHVSEWQDFRGVRVWVNPLHKGGRLAPYTDTAPPVVHALTFHTPPARAWMPTKSLAQPDTSTVLQPSALHGLVELRADIDDPQSFLGFLARKAAWPTQFTPYRVTVTIRRASTGALVMNRVSFQADQLPQTPYIVHYAPGTIEDENMPECVGPPPHTHCAGTTWLRPFSRFKHEYWNTHTVANGAYLLTVRAYDVAGNRGSRSVTVTVTN
jgi:hypothetical protein